MAMKIKVGCPVPELLVQINGKLCWAFRKDTSDNNTTTSGAIALTAPLSTNNEPAIIESECLVCDNENRLYIWIYSNNNIVIKLLDITCVAFL